MHYTKNITLLWMLLITCSTKASEHSHYGQRFIRGNNPGLFIAFAKFMASAPEKKTSQPTSVGQRPIGKRSIDNIDDNITCGVLGLPVLVKREEQS